MVKVVLFYRNAVTNILLPDCGEKELIMIGVCKCCNRSDYLSDDFSGVNRIPNAATCFCLMFLWWVSAAPCLPRLSQPDFQNGWFSMLFLSASARDQVNFFY